MNKKVIIFFLTLTVSIILLVGFIGSIVYSVNQISYDITGNQATPHITKQIVPLKYAGYIEFKTDTKLENNGFYDISNLVIDITVYAYNWSVSNSLNGDQVGQGSNTIGTISSSSSWSGNLAVNITKDIPNFAIENCDLKIDIGIHLVYHPLISLPFDYKTTVYNHYTAPY